MNIEQEDTQKLASTEGLTEALMQAIEYGEYASGVEWESYAGRTDYNGEPIPVDEQEALLISDFEPDSIARKADGSIDLDAYIFSSCEGEWVAWKAPALAAALRARARTKAALAAAGQ